MLTTRHGIHRQIAIDWYRKNRARTAALFDLLTDEAYYAQPIALRHPIVFYEGHLPAFSLNTLVKRALGRPGIDEATGAFVRARHRSGRGRCAPATAIELARSRAACAPSSTRRMPRPRCVGARRPRRAGPSAARLRQRGVHHSRARGDAPGDAALHVAPAAHSIRNVHRPGTRRSPTARPGRTFPWPCRRVRRALGAARGEISFGWDNEFGPLPIDVAAFRIDANNVTNAEFLEFVEDGGYARRGPGGRERTGRGCARTRWSIRRSGSATAATGCGAACSA